MVLADWAELPFTSPVKDSPETSTWFFESLVGACCLVCFPEVSLHLLSLDVFQECNYVCIYRFLLSLLKGPCLTRISLSDSL